MSIHSGISYRIENFPVLANKKFDTESRKHVYGKLKGEFELQKFK